MKQPAVYMAVSGFNGTIYTGVTSDLVARVGEHRVGTGGGFAARYGCRVLVWFELHAGTAAAISREKQIKSRSRARKVELIMLGNPQWADLYPGLVG
jgi:putative endonuclease